MRRSLAPLLLLLVTCAHRPLDSACDHERFDDPDEAAAYFAAKRGITPDLDLNARYAAAQARIAEMPRFSVAADRAGSGRVAADSLTTGTGGTWRFLGPGNIGGRTRVLLVDPLQPAVMYAGAVSGGVWKTTDGGASWTPLADWSPNLAVNSMAFDPADSRVIYAGTGEGYFREEVRGTALPIRGNGIFVTSDAGATWRHLPSTAGEDFYWVNDLVVSPHDPHHIYAATRSGVFRSLDRGESWTRVLATQAKGGCLDLAFRADTASDYLFASCGTLDQATVYRATDAAADGEWTSVLSEPGMGRTTLAIAPSNPSVVYALAAHNGGTFDQGLHAVFRSDSSGDPGSWVAVARNEATANPLSRLLLTNASSAVSSNCSTLDTSGMSNMGWHSNVIAVDPLDPNRVWAAGVDLYRSDDGGRTWGLTSYWWAGGLSTQPKSFLHADQHAIVFDPRYDGLSNQTMFVTNDGGIYRSDNARAAVAANLSDVCRPDRSSVAFTSLNHNYGVTQFYFGAVFPDGRRYAGGAQDNGSPSGTDSGGIDAWAELTGGDGGVVAVDAVDPRYVYTEAQNSYLLRSTDGGSSFSAVSRPEDDYLFIAPFAIDPNHHQRVWRAGRQLWRSENQASDWVAATPSFPSQISAIAVSPGNSDRLLAGTTAGAIFRSDGATSSSAATGWSSVTPRDGWVSSLTFQPGNAAVAYSTYAGFGGVHVWKTADAGASWLPLDGSGDGALPDVPAHSLAIDAGHLYLGTDLGIFVSTDGGAHWAAAGDFPQVITESLVLAPSPGGSTLYAFTHGRGAWRVELPAGRRHRAAGR